MAEEDKVSGETDNTEPSCPRELMKRFYHLQEERIQTYQLFEEGFQAYLNGSPNYNFNLYRQLVHEITETFNKISQDIISIIHRMDTVHQRVTLANLLRKVQDAEQVKLENTAKLQMTRQNLLDHPGDEQHKIQDGQLKQSVKELVEKLIDLMEEIKYESEDLYEEENEDEKEDLENVQVER
ncbi:required for excision 1-B domain-containing protein-like [Ylistrum balloti]|uniref:required for excision 1-B domain-containing protein-like n=1 Tax=Ylistrum balloti TaxID=509963 RepID=UPI002905C184|nr:required for excision 1-B domain-containing protein-like [Ylistrum balloti]